MKHMLKLCVCSCCFCQLGERMRNFIRHIHVFQILSFHTHTVKLRRSLEWLCEEFFPNVMCFISERYRPRAQDFRLSSRNSLLNPFTLRYEGWRLLHTNTTPELTYSKKFLREANFPPKKMPFYWCNRRQWGRLGALLMSCEPGRLIPFPLTPQHIEITWLVFLLRWFGICQINWGPLRKLLANITLSRNNCFQGLFFFF